MQKIIDTHGQNISDDRNKICKQFKQDLTQAKNAPDQQNNMLSSYIKVAKDKISTIETDPTKAEGGTLGYMARLRQVKYMLELANELRKQTTNFVEKVVNFQV